MQSLAYRVGCLAACYGVGLEKTSGTTEVTTLSKALKRLIPKSALGKGTALGGITGVGMGTHMLTSDRRRPGTQMEMPHIIPNGNPLLYTQ